VGASSLGWTRYGTRTSRHRSADNLGECICLFTLDVLLPLLNHAEVGTEIWGHDTRDTRPTYLRLGFGF